MRQLKKQEIKKLSKENKRDKEIYLILENIQYATNVAAIFRTADAAGVRRIYLTGISKTPPFGKDLKKTSRSKEDSVEWMYKETTGEVINTLKKLGFKVLAIELTEDAIPLEKLKDRLSNDNKICLVAGSEVFGVNKNTLAKCDNAVMIPMYGKGASLNVSASVAIALYGI